MYNQNLPLVSICVPTYNGEKYIEFALQSILNQSYKNIEIVISDDNSADNTLSIINGILSNSKIPFYIYKHLPQGIGENWNNCVRNANGKYIKFLFQDDLMAYNCVEKMINLMLTHPKVGLVYCKRKILHDSANIEHLGWMKNCSTLHKSWDRLKIKEGVLDGRVYLKDKFLMQEPLNKIGEPTAVLLKKECFDKIGYFNRELRQVLDFEYWYKLMKHYKIGFIDEELISFRLHNEQATFVNMRSKLNELEILKQIFYKNIFWQLHHKRMWKLFKSQSEIGNWYRFFKKSKLWQQKYFR